MTDTKEKWTKGPYIANDLRLSDKRPLELIEIVAMREDKIVCVARIDQRISQMPLDKEDEANSYLLAAAPDMYAALKSAIEVLQAHCGDYCHKLNEDCGLKNACIWGRVCAQIKDAMAKALGDCHD